jgi:hypothetical protein
MGRLLGSLGDGRERTALIDPIANGIITLPNNHSYIHKGGHFKKDHSDVLASTGDKIQIVCTTPQDNPQFRAEDTLYHMVFKFWHSQPCKFSIIEGGSVTSGGTVTLPMNNMRRSNWADATELIFKTGSNIVYSGGTVIEGPYYMGNRSDASSFRDDDELILDANMNYLFELEQLANGANYAGIELAWYEYVPEL